MTTPKKARKPRPIEVGNTDDLQISSPEAFKKRMQGEKLQLPSGEVCLVTRPGLDKLLVMGLIPDSLTPIADAAVQRGQGKPPKGMSKEDERNLMRDPEKVKDVFTTFDRVCAEVVQQPKVRWHMRPTSPLSATHAAALAEGEVRAEYEEIPQDQRDPNILYTDEVDFEDKMFIFQFVVGGTRDLETFRREYSLSMAGIQPGQEPEGSS